MQDVFGEQLKERREYLIKLIQEKTKALQVAPEGRLRCKKNRSPKNTNGPDLQSLAGGRRERQEFYWVTEPGDTTGRYITKDQKEFVRILAQKDYDQKVLAYAEGEYKRINELEKYRSSHVLENLYEKSSLIRKELIDPVSMTDEEYIEWWLNREFPHPANRFDKEAQEFYTKKNMRVRSKSEILIADRLDDYLIVYIYEFPIYLEGRGWVYPDFLILNIRLRKVYIWEHLGKMDDPGYVLDNLAKIRAYERNGYFLGDNLILTFETKNYPLDTREVDRLINHYLL